MKQKNKFTTLLVLGMFGVIIFGFTLSTIYEYFHYRDGETVSGVVIDVDSYRSGGKRRFRATITATVEGVEITEQMKLSRRGTSIGEIRISTTDISIGDSIDMLVVPSRDGYDMAVAYDVLHPWTELFWEMFTLALISFCTLSVYTKTSSSKSSS